MAITHRVRKPWSGVNAGDLVDISDPVKWRNAARLENQGFIVALTRDELAALADGPPGAVAAPPQVPQTPAPAPADVALQAPPPPAPRPARQAAAQTPRRLPE